MMGWLCLVIDVFGGDLFVVILWLFDELVWCVGLLWYFVFYLIMFVIVVSIFEFGVIKLFMRQWCFDGFEVIVCQLMWKY